ncbi:prefoldin subunit alpha [Candidatus Woesearchaeota archaeon]|nr:prefoldin subunit alpha [Candidatus Woesearchaeota archaeon]
MDEKEQEKMLKMQILEQQIVQVQKQLQQLEGQLLDLGITKEGLNDLKKAEKGSEMLSMISPGIFVKTNLLDNKDVIINVGANVAVKKKLDDARKMVEEQVEDIKKIQDQLMSDMQKLSEAIVAMEKNV